MASRSKPNPVGSAGWVFDERQNASRCVDEEVEEFTYAARNEIEWLNEHMADIFSRNELNVAEAFKTPGKLRGKTPRTARKRNPLEERAPLTDVFAPTPNGHQSPATNTAFFKQVSKFQISAADKENMPSPRPVRAAPQAPKSYVDSGFHDMTDDEAPQIPAKSSARLASPAKTAAPTIAQHSPAKPPAFRRLNDAPAHRESRETQETSFVSAKEVQSGLASSVIDTAPAESVPTQNYSPRPSTDSMTIVESFPQQHKENEQEEAHADAAPAEELPEDQVSSADAEEAVELSKPEAIPSHQEKDTDKVKTLPLKAAAGRKRSLSGSPSPKRPAAMLRKKSSLSFATLPAREPLGKKSMGNRVSRVSHVDRAKLGQSVRLSIEGRSTISRKRYFEDEEDEEDEDLGLGNEKDKDHEMIDEEIEQTVRTTFEASQLQSKTSTQRLHERITMLGKMNPTRPSKSIPAASVPLQLPSAETHHEPAPATDSQQTELATEDENDDWIAPMKTREAVVGRPAEEPRSEKPVTKAVERPVSQASSAVSIEPAPAKDAPAEGNLTLEMVRPKTADYPNLPSGAGVESTTPVGSPARKEIDNALSASRSKLFSWARGIFASSAGASAKGKLEVLSPPPRSRQQAQEPPASPTKLNVKYPALGAASQNDSMQVAPATKPTQEALDQESEERRSSARLRDKRAQTAAQESAAAIQETSSKVVPVVDSSMDIQDSARTAQTTAKPTAAAAPASRPATVSRPASRQIAEPAPKSKPPPVAVRTASQRIGQGVPSNATLANSLHETMASSTVPRSQPTLKAKASSQSIKPSASSTSLKSSQSAASRPKALEAAAKKREQENKEAQRKAEQKREADRRRAAKAEEERRQAQEQREAKLAEQRELEAKNAAQRQQIEQRRQEAIRRNEQMRQQQERPASQAQHRNDSRPVSRMGGESSRPLVPHINPAKPPKRYWQPEDDEEPKRVVGQQKSFTASQSQQPAAKRRRTSEVEASEPPARPTMAPPMRMSTMKNQVPSKFQQGYMSANTHNNGGSSMLKTAVNANHQMQMQMQHPKTPHNMGQYANARIPFAEAPNTAGPITTQQQGRPQPPMYRTPGTSAKAAPQTAAKSSPNYPNGDNISLPDINTDSEDSDSDDSFVPPDWANSPALRELLSNQQLVDPLKVFGPIAPLVMEDVFKGTSKERQAKFRKRTSSAVWTGPDRLTEEERRKDYEAREKLVKQGGWSFDTVT